MRAQLFNSDWIMEKICPFCSIDRHVNACVNLLRMWGCSGYPESPSMNVMRLRCQGVYADEVKPAELREEVGIFRQPVKSFK